jgi:predicted O-linked N-acetylglucosamine transferase (SPINDLY family)
LASQAAVLNVQQLVAEALQHHQAGRLPEAERLYRQILAADSRHADALHLLGVIAHQVERNDVAVELIGKAIGINGAVAVYHSNLGNALKDLGRLDDAVAVYDTAVRLKPDYAEAHYNLGNALMDLGRLGDAVAAYETAIRLKPDLAEAHSNLGNALKDLGRLDDAVAAYETAIRLKPDYAEAHSNLGNALMDLGRLDDAVAACETAIRLKPDYAEAHSNLGNALKDLGRLDDAVAAYETAIRLKPDYADAHSNLMMCLHYQPEIDGSSILEEARRFGARFDETPTPRSYSNSAAPDRRLRIGYVSGDFKRHPVGYFLSRVLTNHDRTVAEVFCYSNDCRDDDLTAQLQGAADHWHRLVGLSDQAAAALVAADGIDILVDLSGHTALNRLPTFALKPAPVQLTWLGYFGTTGLSAMDYILADRFVAPESSASCFTESIWRLPDSYLCFSPPDLDCRLSPPPVTKGEPVTFGNFNNYAKTSPVAVALWSRILNMTPGSRLLLKTKALGNARARRGLEDQFASYGVGANRLLLEGASPRSELLYNYNRIDIALDPTPYGGGTTTAEALWMGVPVVTLRGDTWVGRVSESILSTVGLPELVATTADTYVEITVGLAADHRRLGALRAGLRAQLEASPFCDGHSFTRNLERAYRSMWQNWCAEQEQVNERG